MTSVTAAETAMVVPVTVGTATAVAAVVARTGSVVVQY